MIPKECKRLAEVDFPIAEVSKHAVQEKSNRQHGHPSMLHPWWARRPLASSRAMLMALLLPDPCDTHCPEAFKREARRILLGMCGRPQGWTATIRSDNGLRQVILKFIADFANRDFATDSNYLDVSRALVKVAHGEEPPLVVDPFAGGGSIPLEALRLGCEAFASDLNPVACLILKVMLEDIPRHGPKLAEELRSVGREIRRQVKQELADLYPTDIDGATPVAYLWARTLRCEAPNCGAEIPLMRSFWLCNKAKCKRALRHRVVRPQGGSPFVEFEVFEPEADKDVHSGTVTHAKATCVCCGTVLPPRQVRKQLVSQQGGADVVFDEDGRRKGGARMTAVVTLRPGQKERYYRLPTDADYTVVRKAQKRLTGALEKWEHEGKQDLCPVPDEPLPPIGTLGFRVQRYGMLQWGDLFTARQKVTLKSIIKILVKQQGHTVVSRLLALSMGKLLRHYNVLSKWHKGSETVAGAFAMQTLPMSWDFPEMFPLTPYSGGLDDAIDDIVKATSMISAIVSTLGQSGTADAAKHTLPDETCAIWFTDPPYYDAIPYSDLSDFFLVWLKRILPDQPLLRDPFDPSNPLSPKSAEVVQDETKHVEGKSKDKAWFEETMTSAFSEGRRILCKDGVGSVVFAHKTTEGWEALLSGIIRGGWTISGSWPIATERRARLRARESASLATSIHLICRPRPENASVGDWADVLRELPSRVGDWMKRLQGEGMRGADLVFACIGPALEIFSRYCAVETAAGHEVKLAEYLEKVWEVVGRTALQQVLGTAEAQVRDGLASALEEDARLTALFLWTLQSTDTTENGQQKHEDEDDEEAVAEVTAKGFNLPFDVVRRFAQPMGIGLDVWTGRIIGQEKGVVRLLPVAERAKKLFGENGIRAAANWIESDTLPAFQMKLFPKLDTQPRSRNRRRGRKAILDGDAELQTFDATTLDRVHAAMLLQASGHANALRTLIASEQNRGPEFLRLANALSALYPRGSQEKRFLDAMLLAVPR